MTDLPVEVVEVTLYDVLASTSAMPQPTDALAEAVHPVDRLVVNDTCTDSGPVLDAPLSLPAADPMAA